MAGRGFGKGKSRKKFSFTYEDYSQIIGCSVEAARKHAQRGHFDPSDLVSVLEFIKDRLTISNKIEEDCIDRESVGYARGDDRF
jgi:hypothetical protein